VTAVGRTLGVAAEAAEWASPDAVLHATRLAGLAVTGLVVGWLLVTAGRRPVLRSLGLALLTVVFLGPVVQPWYVAVAAAGGGRDLAAGGGVNRQGQSGVLGPHRGQYRRDQRSLLLAG